MPTTAHVASRGIEEMTRAKCNDVDVRCRRQSINAVRPQALLFLGLPKAEHRAGRIGDDAKTSSPLHLGDVLDEIGTERLGFLRCRVDIFDVNVWHPQRGAA